jgi:hypothetical protein
MIATGILSAVAALALLAQLVPPNLLGGYGYFMRAGLPRRTRAACAPSTNGPPAAAGSSPTAAS